MSVVEPSFENQRYNDYVKIVENLLLTNLPS